MDVIFLDMAERKRFADYLAQEAHTNDGLATQMEGLPSASIVAPVANKLRTEAMAMKVVEQHLRSCEEMTIEGGK